jgi:hypothetical protein
VRPRRAIDYASERPDRQPRHPCDAAPEPREQATDIKLAAADTYLKQVRLLEPLPAWRR